MLLFEMVIGCNSLCKIVPTCAPVCVDEVIEGSTTTTTKTYCLLILSNAAACINQRASTLVDSVMERGSVA